MLVKKEGFFIRLNVAGLVAALALSIYMLIWYQQPAPHPMQRRPPTLFGYETGMGFWDAAWYAWQPPAFYITGPIAISWLLGHGLKFHFKSHIKPD
jgi:hypothetical protein